MPNHCSNQLTTTNPQIIAILRECADSGEEDFINALVPMPLELRGIHTGSRALPDGTIVNSWRDGPDGEAVSVEDERQRLVRDYGTDDWYAWALTNWGTKWGSYSSSYSITDDEAAVTFDTAWSPPTHFLERVTRFYPEGRTQLAFAEGGIGFFGRDVYVDGDQIVSEFSEDNFYNPEVDWDEIDDPMDALTVSCRAHLEAYSLHTGG